MLSGNRITWFAITFLFALPAFLLMFRGNDGVTAQAWMTSVLFAGIIGAGAAGLFGRART